MRVVMMDTTRVIEPDGNWLTDGDTFSARVYLGREADASVWRDAADEEYAEWKRQQEETPSDDEAAGAADYEAALARLGVEV